MTSDLIGCEGQIPNAFGSYELMICTGEEIEWAPNIISRLAPYALEAELNPGETMDIRGAVPDGSSISSFLFLKPDLAEASFRVGGLECGILLCLGITADELAFCREKGPSSLEPILRIARVFPFTDLARKSVLQKPFD